MTAPEHRRGALDSAFLASGSSSFADFVSSYAPRLLPSQRPVPVGSDLPTPHGTTIVAATCEGGVVIAGDRRATIGNIIANRDLDKVFVSDQFSAVGIAGTAGIAIETVRLFQVELEHYEKIEGAMMSLEGKANRLATMIRGNLSLAMQGLVVAPLLVGFDQQAKRGRIFSYDVTGGCYEEHDHHCVGSGSVFAKGSLKKLWRPGQSAAEVTTTVIQALYDAADDDSATGGPDPARRIWPTVAVVDAHGAALTPPSAVADLVQEVIAGRLTNPSGSR